MFAGVIIETRPLPDFNQIIKRHFDYLPDDWDLHIFCGLDNYEYIKDQVEDATLYRIRVGALNAEKYNEILTNRFFWQRLEMYDRVLIFQHDSGLLRKGIEEFLEWDYVGACWVWQEKGGNGGLSLRNPEMMRKCCERYPYHARHGNEDVYFSNHLEKVGGNVAPRDVCSKFSVETIYGLGSLGYHAIERYMNVKQYYAIMNQYKKVVPN